LLETADAIVHVGDFTMTAFLDELRSFAPVAAVHGNMDEAALRVELPERAVIEAEGLRIGLVHDAGAATGRHDRLLAAFPGCAAIAYGHTHMPEVSQAGAVWILNPGSPTERRRAAGHTMIVVDGGVPRLIGLDT
jgi:uncharacterized protein